MAKQTKLAKIDNKRHRVITPVARLSFPKLFKPELNELSGRHEFSCDLIFDSQDSFKEEYKGKKSQSVSMVRAINNAKIDQFGPKEKWPKFKHKVFKEGNERVSKGTGEVYAGYKDNVFVTAKSGEKFPPKIMGKDGKPLQEKDLYGGCLVRAELIARPYDMGGNQGVRFILSQIMKVDDGERFGGGGGHSDVFDVEEEDGSESWGGSSEDSEDESDDI